MMEPSVGASEAGAGGNSAVFCHYQDLAASCSLTHPGSDSATTLMGVIKVKSSLNDIIFKGCFTVYT